MSDVFNKEERDAPGRREPRRGAKHAGAERRGWGWAGARSNLREARSLSHRGCHRGVRGGWFFGRRRPPCCMNQTRFGDSMCGWCGKPRRFGTSRRNRSNGAWRCLAQPPASFMLNRFFYALEISWTRCRRWLGGRVQPVFLGGGKEVSTQISCVSLFRRPK